MMRGLANNRWFMTCLALAFLLRALVPAGFMPDFGALRAGVVKITVCSAGGPKDIWLDHAGAAKADQSHRTHAKPAPPCPFGAAPTAALLVLLAFLIGSLSLRHRRRMPPNCAPPPCDSASPFWSRGPPTLIA